MKWYITEIWCIISDSDKFKWWHVLISDMTQVLFVIWLSLRRCFSLLAMRIFKYTYFLPFAFLYGAVFLLYKHQFLSVPCSLSWGQVLILPANGSQCHWTVNEFKTYVLYKKLLLTIYNSK